MKISSLLSTVLLCGIFVLPQTVQSACCKACEEKHQEEELSGQKVYVAPWQLYICEAGIFFFSEKGVLTSIKGIFHDQDGLYVLVMNDEFNG